MFNTQVVKTQKRLTENHSLHNCVSFVLSFFRRAAWPLKTTSFEQVLFFSPAGRSAFVSVIFHATDISIASFSLCVRKERSCCLMFILMCQITQQTITSILLLYFGTDNLSKTSLDLTKT